MNAAALLLAAALAAPPTWALDKLPGFNSIGAKPFGVLLLGEGGDRDWKATVDGLRKQLGAKVPFEFAAGLADQRSIQRGLDSLQAQRVKLIVIVPLFISSFGEVMDQNRFLLGIREKPSPEYFGGPRARRSGPPPERVKSKTPLVLAKALDDHPLFVELLAARAQTLSRKPSEEAVILAAVASASKEAAAEWDAFAAGLCEKVRQKGGFKAARAIALKEGNQRDREQSDAALRALIRDLRRDAKVLVVPLALTTGGRRLTRALDGLFAKHDGRAVLPDPRIVRWVEQTALEASKLPDMRLFKSASRQAAMPTPPPIPHMTHPGEK